MVCSKKSLSYPSPQQVTLSLEATSIISFLFILHERFLCFYKHFSQNDRCMHTPAPRISWRPHHVSISNASSFFLTASYLILRIGHNLTSPCWWTLRLLGVFCFYKQCCNKWLCMCRILWGCFCRINSLSPVLSLLWRKICEGKAGGCVSFSCAAAQGQLWDTGLLQTLAPCFSPTSPSFLSALPTPPCSPLPLALLLSHLFLWASGAFSPPSPHVSLQTPHSLLLDSRFSIQ